MSLKYLLPHGSGAGPPGNVSTEIQIARLPSAARMTAGALQYSCPKCNNPLFFTFIVEDALDKKLTRRIHCPGCNTVYVADLALTRESEKTKK